MKRDEDRKFPCNVCGMSFRRNDIKRRHEITHSKEYRYFCAICGKGFIRRYVLVKHLARDHDSTDSRKIVYQKNKKKLEEHEHEDIIPSDLSQINDSIEMKHAEEPEEPFTLMVADGVDMSTESEQQQQQVTETKLTTIQQQEMPSNEVEQIKVIINEEDVGEKDLSEEQHHIVPETQEVEEESAAAANIHVAALLTSDMDKSGVLEQLVKVKDECTQVT